MSGTKNNRQRGFTLLEVMIALAIIAVALVVMLGLAQRSVLTNDRLQQMTRATLLAKQRMAEIEHRIGQDSSADRGEFEAPNQEYRWQKIVTPTPISGIVQVDLNVFWGEAKNNEFVTLTSFLSENAQ